MRPSAYVETKAISELAAQRELAHPGSKSMACKYSKRRNLGDPLGDDMRSKYNIKKDNFKTSMVLQEEVRSVSSSEEIE